MVRKRRILDLPCMEEKGTGGEWIEARVLEEILVLDCYEKHVYIGRYYLEPNGRHGFWSEKDQKWRTCRLSSAFQNDWYNNFSIRSSKETDQIVQEFCGNGNRRWKHPARQEISWKESEYNDGEREKKMKRKRDRIDQLMEKVPVLPEAFDRWLKETVFEDREYWFKVGEGKWKCTACGKIHMPNIAYKHGQETVCRRTGKRVQVQNRKREIRKQEMIVVFQNMDDPMRAVARHLKAVRIWSDQKTSTEVYENVRYILGKIRLPEAMQDQFLNEMSGKRGEQLPSVTWYYGQLNDADEFEQEWWDSNPRNKRCQLEYCYPEGVREALKGTVYEDLHLETFADLGWKVHYNKIMINHGCCGFLEYLAKSGLRNLTREVTDNMSVWLPGVHDGDIIRENGRNATEVLGIDMQRFFRLKRRDGGYRCLKWLRWEQQNGKKVTEECLDWMEKSRVDPEDVAFILDRMSPVRVMNYVSGQMKEYGISAGKILENWKDYLSMAKKEKMDTGDSIVYRTKHLLNRHDELLEVINSRNEDQRAEQLRKQYPEVEGVLRSVKEKYEYSGSEFLIMVPDSIRDILKEGRSLHHCVAASERYLERISNQETYILFLRRKSRPLHSWYTLEVEPGGTVRQKRSEYNRQPDLEEVKRFLTEWQKALKERLKEEDLQMAKQSRNLRMMELKELRERDQRFADTLENDLMEVG